MNKSGIYPKGERLLIKPDELEKKTEGGIIIPETERERHQLGQLTGTVIAMGPDCYRHTVTRISRYLNNKWVPFEERVTGYSEPFCKLGERVSFARYAGQPVPGRDGEEYRVMNDEDVTAVIDEEIDFTEFRKRERL